MDVGQGIGRLGHVGLDPVREGVQTGGGIERLGHRGEQPGVGDRDVGDQRAADEGGLEPPDGIGDHAELGQVRAGTGRAGNHDERRDRLGDLVHVLVVQDPAAVRGQHGDGLAGVDHRAAAEADDHVSTGFPVGLEASRDLMVLRVGGHPVPDGVRQAGGVQMPGQLLEPAGLDDARVGDHEDPAGMQPPGREPRLGQRPLAKDDLGDEELRDPIRGIRRHHGGQPNPPPCPVPCGRPGEPAGGAVDPHNLGGPGLNVRGCACQR